MPFSRLRRDDDGSIILSFLAIVVLSGLLIAVAATVLSGQRQTRFDRSFEQALLVAESGQSQMVSLIQSNPAGTSFPALTGSMSEGSYSVTATKTGPRWTVRSVGTDRAGEVRTVESEVLVRPLFGLAAFGKTEVTFRGGNGADSFDSALGTDICQGTSSTIFASPGIPTAADSSAGATNVVMCQRTSLGTVATNGTLNLLGGVEDKIDRAEVHNAREFVTDPLPDALGYCNQLPASCTNMRSTGKLTYHREPIDLPPITACPSASSATPFPNAADPRTLGSRVYSYGDVVLSGDIAYIGTVASPTILCVSGKLTIKESHLVNFEPVSGSSPLRYRPRRPGSLLIFVTGTTSTGVIMGNHASVSAGIYAPNALVESGPQGNVYGSLVANVISNQGGWNFHYDDALGAQTLNAPVRVQNWREVY